jgi:hypothetical protein
VKSSKPEVDGESQFKGTQVQQDIKMVKGRLADPLPWFYKNRHQIHRDHRWYCRSHKEGKCAFGFPVHMLLNI